jgi:DNA polymerase-3 subunit delta'
MVSMFLPLVPGQELAKEYFLRALRKNLLSHAYLFLGPEGAGKRLFARELSKAFFCASGTACGECSACRSIEHCNHPAVDFFGPAPGKSVVDIDTVRSLCERTHYKTGSIQIAVLERADLLNEPAANALLKTLEEPPGSSLVILTAQSSGSLLPTIVSRCHRLLFTGPKDTHFVFSAEMEEALGKAAAPQFFAEYEPRQWLTLAVPASDEGVRGQVRTLLDALLAHFRERLRSSASPDLDCRVQSLERLLELREDIDRNVNADLILERILADILRPAHRPA